MSEAAIPRPPTLHRQFENYVFDRIVAAVEVDGAISATIHEEEGLSVVRAEHKITGSELAVVANRAVFMAINQKPTDYTGHLLDEHTRYGISFRNNHFGEEQVVQQVEVDLARSRFFLAACGTKGLKRIEDDQSVRNLLAQVKDLEQTGKMYPTARLVRTES